jgi:hypothetical protein
MGLLWVMGSEGILIERGGEGGGRECGDRLVEKVDGWEEEKGVEGGDKWKSRREEGR